ncbi:LysR family transcriptional regulator [Shouchella sp. 1P09AA]|uniref:LysR family transcriptional regulator n=1 Tax=unclassified Shouchella TaxID=2893065 RepID=UPI00399F92AD
MMELLQLTYFKVVAELEHMTKAAKVLHVSQPALSKVIQRLESDLGVTLFERTQKGLRLNENGKVFLHRVERIFLEMQEGRKEVRDLAELSERTISVSMALPHILPHFLDDYLKKHKDVHILHYSASAPEMVKQLEEGEVDLCISTSPIEGKGLKWQVLMEEEVYLSVPLNHPLAHRKRIELVDVQGEKVINRNKGYHFRELIDDFCRQAGFEPTTTIELEEAGAILRMVELGQGVSFTPQLSLLRETLPKTVQLEITNPVCKREIGIAWNEDRYLTRAAQEFKAFAITFFEKAAKQYYQL